VLFARFGADMTLAPPQIMATECLALLRTPLLAEFLDLVRAKDNLWAYALAESLRALVGEEAPLFWSFAIDDDEAPGLSDVMRRGKDALAIGDFGRSAHARDDRAPCLAVLLVRGRETVELPGDEVDVRLGDRLLFAGRRAAKDNQSLMLSNANVAAYVLGDRRQAEGWIWRTFEKALAR